MKAWRLICLALGVLHAAAMTMFARGEEPSPLVVLLVDWPIAELTRSLAPSPLRYAVPIGVCSLAYPVVLYWLGRSLGWCWRKMGRME